MSGVIFLAAPDPEGVKNGSYRPQRVTAEAPQTAIYTCDAKDRTEGSNGFNFAVACGADITRARSVKLTKALLPKLPTINPNNNVLRLRWTGDGVVPPSNLPFPVEMRYGYYNQVSLATEFKRAIDTTLADLGIVDTVSVVFDATTKTFTMTSNVGNNWYIASESTFAIRGINVAKFTYVGDGTGPGVSGSVSHTSSPVGLIYSRYVNIFSNRLTENVYTSSRTSAGANPSIIGSMAIVNDYNATDFDSTGVFTGNLISDVLAEGSPTMNVAHNQKSVNRIDFLFEDEFGLPLNTSLDFGTQNGVTYPPSGFNCAAWLQFGV